MTLIKNINRRHFLKQSVPAAGALVVPGLLLQATEPFANKLITRGVVLITDDLETLDWPLMARESKLTTIGTHISPEQVKKFVGTERGQTFLSDCKRYKINVEHELHAMHDLLPRKLFDKNPEMFRMNKDGVRVADYNCCTNSTQALEIISENAVRYAEVLTPTTMRFFYWIDDAVPMCYCDHCRNLSDSDQALIIENAMIRALRKVYPNASLAHLAYVNTLKPPTQVKPEEGIFLEFAPIYRRWDKPITDREAGIKSPKQGQGGFFSHGETIDLLYANLEVFPPGTAQVLEYWLDVSLQSKWKKPAQKISWHPDVCKQDVEFYNKCGIRHITTFAAYIDGTYKNTYKDTRFVNEYGSILRKI